MSAPSGLAYECADCGQSWGRAQSLGSHRAVGCPYEGLPNPWRGDGVECPKCSSADWTMPADPGAAYPRMTGLWVCVDCHTFWEPVPA